MVIASRAVAGAVRGAWRPCAARSRRPVARVYRATAAGTAELCARWKVSPDLISFAGLAVAVAAGICLLRAVSAPALLLVVPALLALRLWLNMLDGMVAFARNRAGDRGWLINDVTDLLADLAVFIGAAHSALCAPALAYGAALAALLTSHVGVLGEAVGVGRTYSGPLSKPVRMLVLGLGCLAQTLHPAGLSASLALIVVGCALTMVIRWRGILRRLRARHTTACEE